VNVVEATQGLEVVAGTVYIAPGGQHMVLSKLPTGKTTVLLNADPPENSCRPAADPLFRSVVAAYGVHALGVVMTGMGHDGCSGAQALVDAGAEVLAQDEATCVVWGMPGAVVHAGLAVAEVPLPRVVEEIMKRLARGRVMPPLAVGARR
jgi:two-component system chemotaxis response regulator CheB